MGGQEKGFGIFIDKVEKGTKAAEIGLKRGNLYLFLLNLWIYNLLIIIIFCSIGDQLLEVNRRSFENNMTLQKAITILMENTHLEMIVKSNLLGNNHKVPQLNFLYEKLFLFRLPMNP